eukprot:g4131.t1
MYRCFGYVSRLRKSARTFASFVSPPPPLESEEESLDKIQLRDLKLFGYHGVLPEEKRDGQNFLIDATLFLSLRQPGLTDNVHHTVNYASVYEDIEQIMKGPSMNLIEHLAEKMCRRILEEYPPIKKVQVSIRKPEAPLPCPKDAFGSVGVVLLRNQEEEIRESVVDD